MSRRTPRLPRRALLLAIGWLWLAAQQLALLHPLTHPLAHLGGTLQAHAAAAAHEPTHEPTAAAGAAAHDCALCLAAAAAAHLAAATPAGSPALPRNTLEPVAAAPVPPAAWAPGGTRNRGPPPSA